MESSSPSEFEPPESLHGELARLGVELDAGDLERLQRYLSLLLKANEEFNLTAIRDPAEAWTKHVLDSLTLLPLVASAAEASAELGGAAAPLSVVDVGSGGGVPGLVLAVVLPAVRFTLLEATGKKARFLEEAAQELKLANVRVVNDRAENAGQDHRSMRERFDLAVARAVGPLPVLLELTLPFVRVGGSLLAIKGEKAAEEVASAGEALRQLGGAHVTSMRTPTGTIVVIEKVSKTPRLYPRFPGEPKRRPLGARS